MKKVLIVEDDVAFNLTLKSFLTRNGFSADEAFSSQKAMEKISTTVYDIIISDFRLPDENGIELLKKIKDKIPDSIVIIMTAYADIQMAVRAIKFGAYEYIAKPLNPDELLKIMQSGIEAKQKEDGTIHKPNLHKRGSSPKEFEYIEVTSEESKAILEYINLVAPTDMSVIIQGESGTGKEFIARKIHELSHRNQKPFIAVDCGALSQELAGSDFFGHVKGSFTGALHEKSGQFEVADKGTIFLDEIGNLSYEIQIKLLRAIQERVIRKIGSNKDIPVDVRILAATNDNLLQEVKEGNFREDLYHRLNEFSILVPPLRSRTDDIPHFVRFFLQRANDELGRNVRTIPDDVMASFIAYSWPGNIREVKNVIRRAVLLSKGESLEKAALPVEILMSEATSKNYTDDPTHDNSLKDLTGKTEKEIIIATLQKAKFNKSKAAQLLNIDRRTLYNKLKLYGIPLD